MDLRPRDGCPRQTRRVGRHCGYGIRRLVHVDGLKPGSGRGQDVTASGRREQRA